LTFLVLIPVWLILVLLFRPDFSGVTLQAALLATPAILIGFAVNFLFGATLTCLAFWTTRIYSLAEFFWAVRVLFSGQFVPLPLMPPVIQKIADFLPFQYFIYLPIQIFLGKVPFETILGEYAIAYLASSFHILRCVAKR
jgi:ABC-2 type transport system permease protein